MWCLLIYKMTMRQWGGCKVYLLFVWTNKPLKSRVPLQILNQFKDMLGWYGYWGTNGAHASNVPAWTYSDGVCLGWYFLVTIKAIQLGVNGLYPQTLRIIRVRPEHVRMPVFSQSIVVFCRRFLTVVVAGDASCLSWTSHVSLVGGRGAGEEDSEGLQGQRVRRHNEDQWKIQNKELGVPSGYLT
jgi:hypothetical protein